MGGVHDDIDGFVRATDRGLEYLQQFVVPASVLNEDNDGTDEVFVRARFVDGDCGNQDREHQRGEGQFLASQGTGPVQRKLLRRARGPCLGR